MQFITVNEAIERIGFGRFQVLLIGLSGLGFGIPRSCVFLFMWAILPR
jgi:hypothetical protein